MLQLVGRNDMRLSAGDAAWIEAHVHESNPRDLINNLLARKFDNPHDEFPDDQALCRACYALAKGNEGVWARNATDASLYADLLNLADGPPDGIIDSFHLLWKGYTDDDLIKTESQVAMDRGGFESQLAEARRRLRRVRRRISTRKSPRLRSECRKIAGQHVAIARDIRRAFRDVTSAARMKLRHAVAFRRSMFDAWLGLAPDDYLAIQFRLIRNDPEAIAFPLRHMIHLYAQDYRDLLARWHAGASREDLILAFDSDARERGTGLDERFATLNAYIAGRLGTDVGAVLPELAVCYEKHCDWAAALLATTATEGLIWDLAAYLNRRGIRIYKKTRHRTPVYHPYLWDPRRDDYMAKDSRSGRPVASKRRIASVWALLEETRIGTVVQPELISYLCVEFRGDRNAIVHGRLAGRSAHVDAMAAILALWCCMESIYEYLGGTTEASILLVAAQKGEPSPASTINHLEHSKANDSVMPHEMEGKEAP